MPITEVVVAAHADVCDVGGAAVQDVGVRRRHVAVCAGDQADAAVERVAHRHLLAGRLGVDVGDDAVDRVAEAMVAQRAFGRGERIVERIHEQPAHHLQHHHPARRR